MTEDKIPYTTRPTRPCFACGQPVDMGGDAFTMEGGKVRHVTCPARPELAAAVVIADPAAEPRESYAAPPVQFRTVAEAAEMLRCHADTIRNRIAEGKLRGYRMPGGKQVLVRESDLLDMLEPVTMK